MFSIVPTTGYVVSDVLVDGSSAGAVSAYSFTGVNADHTISATFTVETHTITVSAGANGTITPSGTVTVDHAASAAFTITANNGYHVDTILIDSSSLPTGTATTTSTTYTFSNVTSFHTISATFAADTVPVLDSIGPVTSNVKISPKINKRNNPGQVTLTALVNDAATGGSNISAAQYRIDNGAPVAMSASDGQFNSASEQVTALINVAALPSGRHIIYVNGEDSAGNWGTTARIAFRVVVSTNPAASTKRVTTVGVSSDDDSVEEIEIDENSKGDVVEIVQQLSGGQDTVLWPNSSSGYSDSE